MLDRAIASLVEEALADSPVVLLHGARQTGKTTLARTLVENGKAEAWRYLTFDDATVLGAALADPQAFVRGLSGKTVLDEIQRAPALFPAIKLVVDENRQPGRFLLTGSANVLMLPQLSESLAGRMEILTLWPFATAELVAPGEGSVVDRWFAGEATPNDLSARGAEQVPLEELWDYVLRGGFPEAFKRPRSDRRRAWFNSYLTTILQRDVRDLSNVEGLTQLPRLLEMIATRVGGMLNFSGLARTMNMPQTTLKRYFSLLEATFLVRLLPAWSANLGKRLVKAPKLYLSDTGLVTALLGLNEERLADEQTMRGPLLENYVVMEVTKQASWSRCQPSLFHYRTHAGQEVDLVLEDSAGRVVGVEVKASGSVGSSDFSGLRHLSEALGDRFHRGVLLYGGTETVAFGPNLTAAPVSSMWG